MPCEVPHTNTTSLSEEKPPVTHQMAWQRLARTEEASGGRASAEPSQRGVPRSSGPALTFSITPAVAFHSILLQFCKAGTPLLAEEGQSGL